MGLRAGELTGLRVRDLNLTAGHIEVRQTLARIGGVWKTSTPKSAHSSRNVPLVDRALVRDLRAYLVAHPNSGDPEALLWPGRRRPGRTRGPRRRLLAVGPSSRWTWPMLCPQ